MNVKLLPALIVTSLLFTMLVSACCTKVGCIGVYYKDIKLDLHLLGNEVYSLQLKEFYKNTDSLIKLSSIQYSDYSEPSFLRIGSHYGRTDSFYLDQRFFVLVLPMREDTINDIHYNVSRRPYNCNNCPFSNESVMDISNFSYKYRGATYHENDTIIVTP